MRESARFLFRRPFVIGGHTPVISFTFDDFPRSALLIGGEILKSCGLVGTYYVSLGLMGRQAPTGRMFVPEDLNFLLKEGHEIGCHTFGHWDAWETDTDTFEKSTIENRDRLNELVPGASFQTLSYPMSVPRARTKRKVAEQFACCRCGGQTLNVGDVDLNCLSAFFLEQSRDNPEKVKQLIDQNQRVRGWLIFATHDIRENPSPFGCTPDFFEDIVKYAVQSRAWILPVFQAWEVLRTSRPS